MITLLSFFTLLCSNNVIETINCSFDVQAQVIVIEGLNLSHSMNFQNTVTVYFGEVDKPTQLPQLLGAFEEKGKNLLFYPKYGFSSGAVYTVFIKIPSNKDVQYIHRVLVKVPERKVAAQTFVKMVYPTSKELPMNQLKLYIEFSNPMRAGKAFEHIKLYRLPMGLEEKYAFLTMPEELWDPERKRLTVLFDPGRIKRGVMPNLQLGLPLVEGNSYKLIIDKAWLDMNGAPLLQNFEKTFLVTRVDRCSPIPDDWRIDRPEVKTKEPLRIHFYEPMDYGLLHSTITVIGEGNNRVKGHISVSKEESVWVFTPSTPWQLVNYKIRVNAWLEDLAGNNLKRKFDVDMVDPADKPKDFKEIIIPLKIKKRNL